MSEMEPGTEFGGYRIDRLLGAGGFCNVYLAEDLRPALRRKVALKVLNPTLSADDKNRERFQRESLLAVELDDHPNIVGVLDAGEQDGQLFIAQRYIEGHDLAEEIVQKGPLTPTRAVEVITEIAGALDYAHQAGLVHRDVKPRNILIRERDDRCFLADFGLTKRTASSDSLTGAGEFLGTFAYAAPEQLGGQAVDGRADLYALGCVLFESLTGSPPFGGDIHTMITSHLTKPPPRLSEARTDLPPAVDAVVEKAMAKEPADRYQTGHEFAEAARKALLSSGLPPPATPPPPVPSSGATVSTPTPATASGGFSSGGYTTPPPGPLPTPAGGAGGGRSKTPLVIGGLLVLVVLGVVGALLLGGGGDDSSSDEGSGPTETTVDPEAEALAAAEAAEDDLPDGLDDGVCELDEDVGDYDDDVVATFGCDGEDGADDVTVTVFGDEEATDDAFDDAVDAAAENLDEEGDCEVDRYAVHSWTSNDEPDSVLGEIACYLDDDSEAEIAWTVDEVQLLAVAHRGDDGDAALYRWWAELVDRAAPDDTAGFPNTEESNLLSHVPEEFRDTCVRAELRPRETASVQCSPPSGASVVFYNQYPTPQGANAQYETLRGINNIQRNVNVDDPDACPYESPLTINDEPSGRVFCANNDQGVQILVWSNRALAIQAEATIAEGATVAEFWDWWTNAGPS